MCNVENVKLGEWLIITHDQEQEAALDRIKNSSFSSMITPRIKYTGIPYKVLAISYPFILVQVGNSRSVIDTRQVKWTKANKRYVEQFKGIELPISAAMFGSSSERDGGLSKICPRCGSRMVERETEGVNVWHLYCEDCGGEFI